MRPDALPVPPDPVLAKGGAFDVFRAFLRLGLTSFGGPIAHLGYFQAEFVERRRWLDARGYADLVALCQFLPGPTSSQVGFALGLHRAGWAGALAAWLGFTLPSALLMMAFAQGIVQLAGSAASGALHGLKVVAVAVVAQAVWNMARTLCPERRHAGIAILCALVTLALPSTAGQLAAIVLAGVLGRWWLASPTGTASDPSLASPVGWRVSPAIGALALAAFAALLIGLPLMAVTTGAPAWALIDGFYRAGSLVFGGGHVMLPLLQAVVVPSGAVDESVFLAGYGAAQALPGPLTTFAAYLGTVMSGPLSGWTGGVTLLVVIFLPSFLVVIGVLPFWDRLRRRDTVRTALAGINAGVVGLLLSALYDPVWTSAIHGKADFALGLAAFGGLAFARLSPLVVVAVGAAAGWIFF